MEKEEAEKALHMKVIAALFQSVYSSFFSFSLISRASANSSPKFPFANVM
jgi:hypothetical protein